MKKTTFVYLLTAFSCYLMISSYKTGPAANGYDCTGAETGLGNPTGCYAGSGCHSSSATAGITISIELDSLGVPTTHYKGGMNYSVKLTGTNNTTNTLKGFGFQMGSIKGSVALTTPTNAGTWITPYPTNTHHTAPSAGNFVVSIVEHSAVLLPTTGSGGNGTIYAETFNWTAPIAGTGVISIWAALNAVNANGNADTGDKWNTNHIVINEWSSGTGIVSVNQNTFDLNIYPNPASDYAAIDYMLEKNTDVKIELYNISGKKISDLLSENQSSGAHRQLIDFAPMNLKKGVYLLILKTNAQAISRMLVIK